LKNIQLKSVDFVCKDLNGLIFSAQTTLDRQKLFFHLDIDKNNIELYGNDYFLSKYDNIVWFIDENLGLKNECCVEPNFYKAVRIVIIKSYHLIITFDGFCSCVSMMLV
jgi:hypothetical protein